MNKAFLAVGVAFLAVGVASSTVAGGIVWSTFVTLGVVFLALAFAFREADAGEGRSDAERENAPAGGVEDDA
ncbi:hypothetical protein [Halorubellus litoreus]|uniref:Uncharacterized protein n=1 Tax=Halorubellus litoreus TaxID=755308 RepID=A0ABD5VGA3_9EURY